MELILRDTLTHSGSRANTTSDHLQQLIDIVGTTPLLMLDDINTQLRLGLLHQLAIRTHTLLAVRLGKLVANQGRGVQTSQGDKLPAVAQLGQTLDVSDLLVGRHGGLPVERGGQVVGELLLGPDGVDAVGKLLGLLEVGQLALHPDGVAVGAVGDGAVDGAVAAALEAVVALAGAGGVPVEEDVHAQDAAGDGARFRVGLALGGGEVVLLELVAVEVGALADGFEDGVVEALEVGAGDPLVLDGLQGVAVLARGFGGDHQVVERLQVGVG